jgi:predicted MFS family arabinose efflux permease
MTLFTQATERARAMGIYGFICAAGGSIGELLGGFLTKMLGWHWIFLVNAPIGLAVFLSCRRLLERDAPAAGARDLDVAGSVTVTAALMLAVYAVVNANSAGWSSLQTLGLLTGAIALLLLFSMIEQRAARPLMPLHIFRLRNLAIANALAVLWAAGMFAWFVISALYLQHVLGYDPLGVGLSFLPADLIMAAFSAGLSARLVTRFGIRGPAWVGLALATLGLLLFARAPASGTFIRDVLPGMLLLGLGAGIAFNPLLLAAMNDADPSESGLASGVVNTAFMMGGALGLAVLASLGELHAQQLLQAGASAVSALNGGYHLAFILGAVLTGLASITGALWLRAAPALATGAQAP